MPTINQLFDRARRETGSSVSYDTQGNIRHVMPKTAASVGTFSLRELTLPPFLPAMANHRVHIPMGTEAGKRTTLSAAIMQASRVAQAGANIMVVEEASEAIPQGSGDVVLTKRTDRFELVEPANFVLVPDGSDLSASALPVFRSEADVATMPSYGFRVELSRAEQKAYEDGQLADITLASIAMGIARLADHVLLKAIADTTPDVFTLAAVAAAGYEWAELRALVGTAGSGAATDDAGVLRAAGVLAELTPVVAATIVGSFKRAAVAVHQDITLTVERLDAQGRMVLTCWVNAEALLPNPAAFWTVD